MRAFLISILFLSYFSFCYASIKHNMTKIISDRVGAPVRLSSVVSSNKDFNPDADYKIVKYAGSIKSGIYNFLLKNGTRYFWVRVKFEVNKEVFVAKKVIYRGFTITSADVEKKVMWLSPRVAENVVDNPLGMKATRDIKHGEIIKISMVKKPKIVKNGDLVKVLLVDGVVVIETQAKALRGGGVGDLIPLQNIRSGRKFVGEIIGRGRVLVK